jgi:hypothetical protein
MNCTVNDCTKPARSSKAPLCEMHYNRIRRNGHLALLPTRQHGPCRVDGCDRIDNATDGLCAMHRERIRRHGDPTVCLAGSGELNPNWRGRSIKYRAAHERLHVERGPAASHQCSDCGHPAAHWSYNHTDPNELHDANLGLPYSPDPAHYSPRCVPCHKSFDLGKVLAHA